ncbi:hypothetical protein, conserved [Babesia ovata]|uniref:Extracellular matrix-binding ebh n=1 Tax=Babesia ovata TaxID=189622 RepID=A0A2H6KJT3_9APIC|nr:uncharacterized protein BOVATA_047450 [Babesia ovata]GBE63252.1 hypothetical protein, conserved [Babesia ovata]
MVSLAELSGKLGQFIGKSDAVTTAINNGINIIIDSNEDFKSLKKSPSSTALPPPAVSAVSINVDMLSKKIEHFKKEIASLSAQIEQLKNQKTSVPDDLNKSHESCQSKLDALQKLKSLNESFESLKSPQDKPCETLLNNLCSGLEKFLGYNEHSKGYDGSGIVYSDLDRLCDGVMSFLHGVLSNIHGHLGLHSDEIRSAIESLERNKHLGKEGFNTAIQAVVTGVNRYNEGVKASNNAVITPIKKLQDEMEDLKNAVSKIQENNSSVGAIDKSVTECLSQAQHFVDNITQNSANVSDLSDDLKRNVIKAKDNIEYQRGQLGKIHEHQKGDLKAVTDFVSKQLDGLKRNVFSCIEKDVGELVRKLKNKVSDILKQVVEVNNSLKKYVQALDKWMRESNSLIEGAQNDVKEIRKEVTWHSGEGETSENWMNAVNTADELKKKAQKLLDAAETAKKQVQSLVTVALEGVKTMDDELKKDLHGVRGQIKGAIIKLATTLEGNVKSDLKVLEGNIDSGLNPIVGSAQTFKLSLQTTKGALIKAMKSVIGDVGDLENLANLEQIKGADGTPVSAPLLQKLADQTAFGKLTEYFQQIKTQLTEPLRTVMGTIGDAVGKLGSPAGKNDLKEALKTAKDKLLQLHKVVRGDLPTPDVTQVTLDGATVKIEGVHKLELNRYARHIESVVNKINGQSDVIEKTQLKSLFSTLRQIDQTVSEHSEQVVRRLIGSIKNQVTTEVKSVAGTIKANAEKIRLCINQNQDHDVDYSAKNSAKGLQKLVETFDTSIKGALGNLQSDLGKTIFKKASTGSGDNNYDLTQVMPQFHGTYDTNFRTGDFKNVGGTGTENVLDEEIGKDILTGGGSPGNKISELAKKNFTEYIKQVDQDSLSLPIEQLKGELPEKIKKIRDTGLASLSIIDPDATPGETKIEKKTFEDLFTKVDSYLNQLCGSVRRAVKGLEGNLEHLTKNSIDIDLKKIHNDLHILQNEKLKQAIKDADRFLDEEAKQLQEECINHLKSHLIKQVGIAESAITQDLRAKYVKFMKAQLEAFAEKCQTELQPLPDKITADADKGAKGFMKKMESIVGRLHKHDDVSVLSTNASVVITVLTDHVKTLLVRKTGIRSHVKLIYLLVHKMFEELGNSKHFDPTFTDNLHTLKSKLNDLTPKQFGEESTALLQSLKDGMTALTDVLSKCYINAYEGAKPIEKWTEPLTADQAKEKLTPDGERCAKACLTIVPIIRETLGELAGHLEKDDSAWRKYKMYTSTKQARSLHKEFFRENGYDITLSDSADSGELNHKDTFKGNNIYTHITAGEHVLFSPKSDPSAPGAAELDGISVEVSEEKGLIPELNSYHQLFLQVCHHTHLDSPRVPCSIYEMLAWCCGFPFSPVFEKFEQHINSEFMVADKAEPTKKSVKPIEASPSNVTAPITVKALTKMCEKAYPVLTSILGNGHASGIYAVEFSNNSLKLYYPSSMVQLLCMLYDIAKRLHQQLHFLYQQCKYGSDQSGWRECWYGNQIGGSSFQCNSLQCDNQDCKLSATQSATQKGNQRADQPCNQHPTCGVKSPLQSFLEDGLVGYLPHNVSFRGTNITCSSCPKSSPSTPCKTPMGFPEIAVTASHRNTGKHIYDVLRNFCSRSDKPLSQLCRYLQCLLHRTPQSLDDMWAFYYNFLTEWHGKGRRDEVGLKHKKEAFENAVNAANFKREYEGLKVQSILSTSHTSKSMGHPNGDLFSLICNSKLRGKCGPYLHSLTNDIAGIYSKKYAGRYLSWIVYLTQTFYSLLQSLYEECNRTCGGDKARCRIAKCPQNCNFNDKSSIANHDAGCSSIIQCKSTSSVLCRYGFMLSDRKTLSGTDRKRTCNDFCSVLKKVLDGESVLVKLFNAIDEFMKEIRWPFMLTLLALWSLSLLYLLHIAVVRLDVLRIRSHLRSPSSHRIAAQSLLAAARVKHGGDTKGIEHLAKALKKLIGGAIKNATESLEKRKEQLECPKNSKFCNEKKTQIEEKQHEINKASETSADKAKKESEISKLKSDKEKHYNEVHYLTEDAREKALKDITERQTKLAELQKKLEAFIGTKDGDNPATEILKNLCSGLEKFLGFNSESKGYSGEGIVYSDLDRLCDGVMSFLHGVLHNIQPKLGQHKDTLDSALNSLKDTNDNGITKYRAAIAAVASGVRAYNESVAASNESVSDVITTLRDSVDASFVRTVEAVLQERRDARGNIIEHTERDVTDAERQINEKLQQCQKNATTFVTNLDTSRSTHKDAIDDLNANLKDKLENVRVTVQYESARLGRVKGYESERFTKVEKEIKRVLEAMKCSVDKSVSADITRILGELKQRVTKFLEELHKLSRDLGQYVIELESWIRETQQLIDGIKNKGLDNILNEVNDSLTSKKLDIKDAVDKDLKNWKGKLEGYIQQLTQLTGEVDAKVTALASKFPKNAGGEFCKSINEIFGEIKGKAVMIKSGVLGTDVHGTGIVHNWNQIKQTIGSSVHAIHNKDINPKPGHLDKIVEAVKGYAEGFTRYFEQKIGEMVDKIADSGAVSGKITDYVVAIRNNNELSATNKKVKMAIKTHIVKIAEGIQNPVNKMDVEKTLESIQGYLGGYAAAVKRKRDSDIVAFIGDIKGDNAITAISGLKLTADDTNLKLAVQSTLTAVSEAADEAGRQVGKFMNDIEIKQLSSAIAAANNIKVQLDGADLTIDAPLQRLEEPITYLHTNVNSALQDPTQTNHAANLDQAITDVKDRVAEVAANAIPQKLEGVAQKIKHHLETLADAVSRTTNDVRLKLAELQNEKIGNASRTGDVKANTLQDLRRKLNELHKSLESDPIKNADEFIKYVTAAETHYIDELKRHTKKAADDACNQLTTHARRQYVEALKFALRQFADKVTEELEPLPGMFENDKHIGLKGFMEAFYGNDAGDNINKLKDGIDLRTVCHGFEKFLGPLNTYISREIDRVKEEEHKKNPSLQKYQDPYSKQLNNIYSKLSTVIGHIITKNHYDNNLPTKLAELTATLSDLKLDGFPNPVTVMLGGISGGCRQLVEVLGNVYISKYDGQTIEWEKADTSKKSATKDATENKIPTENANRCAKVFLTCMYTLFDKLHHLFYNGGSKWSQLKIDGSTSGRDKYYLKKYLMEEGFEIQNLITKENTGKVVAFKLSVGFTAYQSFNTDPGKLGSYNDYLAHFKKHEGLLSRLFEHLETYNEVCHFATFSSTKHPSSIYEMLAWFSGLPYSSVYDSLLHDVLPSLLEGPSKKPADDDEIEVTDLGEESFDAYPQPITYSSLATSLNDVCAQSYDVLTGVLGYGYAGGVYACDHSNNTLNLAYPSSANACLGMMVDIMNRLFSQLYFLLTQCSHNTDYSGWSNCSYGQGVGNSGWQCNDNLCANQTCPQKANHGTNQKCNQHPKCGVKSPLQSFLEDGLPGFLPHTFSNVGCGVKCSVGNHFGKTCLTPMGFTDISIKASHTKEGEYLQKVLKEFCGKAESPLTKLCSQLNCLLPTTPKTLGDMFSFYHNFLNEWNTKTEHKRDAFAAAVNKANFEKRYKGFDPAIMFGNPKHSHKQVNADLSSLVCVSTTTQTCGPYLQSINHDVIGTFSKNHAGQYLSWIVYMTETFYDLLKKLYDDCCATCGGDYPKCRVARGQHTCNTANQPGSDNDSDTCNSIVSCQHTRPTIYKYGFVHNDVISLAGKKSKKSCKDFCDALKKVLNNEEKIGATLAVLIYKTIPNFLWKIREPFSLTLLALWSLSLLYLLHITVVRLDVLRIRSHLRSPSSHRIAAQVLIVRRIPGALGSWCITHRPPTRPAAHPLIDQPSSTAAIIAPPRPSIRRHRSPAHRPPAHHRPSCPSTHRPSRIAPCPLIARSLPILPALIMVSPIDGSNKSINRFARPVNHLSSVAHRCSPAHPSRARIACCALVHHAHRLRHRPSTIAYRARRPSMRIAAHRFARPSISRIAPAAHHRPLARIIAKLSAHSQVKHGNGNGKGLGPLAEALKKLIEDAIESATRSLKSKEDELKCADKGSDGLYGNYCNTLQKKIEDEKDGSQKSRHQSDLKKHYSDVHSSEDKRRGALDDIDARRISLGTLAGQLMGFIGSGQEVKDALLKGLHSNVSQLEKLLNASCGGEGCCKNKLPGIEKLKETKSSDENNVERQFNGLQPKLSEIEKEIAENISKLNTTIQRFESEKTAKKDAFSEKDSKSLNSHQSSMKSLETLKELCQFANSLTQNQQNNPRDLLESLCSGLQTFLGYNEKSKGYDGSGIVYSDLDRLCDGVMAFLHSVLKDVHDKQPYNVGKNILRDNVLSHFNGKLCSGHNGFKSVIGQVADGVGRYNREVERSNRDVKTIITGMKSKMESLRDQVSGILNDHSDAGTLKGFTPEEVEKVEAAVSTAEELAKEYAKNGAYFENNFYDRKRGYRSSTAEPTQQFKDLNPALRDKINSAIENISYEGARLTEMSAQEKEKLAATTEKIKKTMKNLQNCVDNNVGEKVNALCKKVKERLQKILEQLKKINKQLSNYVAELDRWIKSADGIVGGTINETKKIMDKGHVAWPLEDKIKGDVDSLKDKALELYGHFTVANQEVENLVKQALEAVKAMDAELKQDLFGVRGAINNAIKELAKTLEGNVKSDLGVLEGGIRSALTEHVKKVLQKIQESVGKIKGPGNVGKKTGLEAVKLKVAELTRAFVNNGRDAGFTYRVDGWLDGILGKDKGSGMESVKTCITKYVEEITQLGKTDVDENKVKEEMKRYIKNQLDTDNVIKPAQGKIDEVKDTIDENNITKNLEAIKEACEEFVKKLDEKIKNGENADIVTNIVGTIQTGFQLRDKYASRAPLRSAVHTTLIALCSSVKQVATELNSFALVNSKKPEIESIAENVTSSLADAGTLDSQLGQATNGRGSGPGKVLSTEKTVELAHYNAETYIEAELKQKFPGSNGAAALRAATTPEYQFGDKLMSNFHDTHKKLLKGQIASATTGVSHTDDVLEQQLKEASGSKVNIQNSEGFRLYKQQVDQSKVDGDPDTLAGALPNKIKEIKTQVENAVKDIEERKKEADGKVDEVRKTLTALYDAVKEVGGNLKSNLTTLRDTNIRKNLDGIKKQLENLKELELKTVIQDVERFMKSLDSSLEPTIQLLGNHVRDEVASAEKTLITHARKQYVNAVKFLLEKFADRVTEELRSLPEQIKKDLAIGHKGFMEKIYDHFITRVQRINEVDPDKFTTTESPLNQAAKKLNGALSLFFIKFKQQEDFTSDSAKIRSPQKALDRVLTGLWASNHFDNKFSNNLDALNDTLATFNPKTYGEGKYPYILESFKKGFSALFTKLEHAYVNAYSGMKFTRLLAPKKVDMSENVPDPQRPASNVVSTSGQLSDPSRTRRSAPAASSPVPSTQPTAPPVSGQKAETEYELTPEGRDCAKVCVTIMERVKNHLFVLERECNSGGRWRHNSIRLYDHTNGRKTENPLGTWLRDHGFRVPSEEGKQDGELRNNLGFTGHKMKTTLLDHNIPGASQVRSLLDWVTEERQNASPGSKKSVTVIDVFDIAHCLRDIFRKYYEVCHHERVDSPRAPSNIYDMLQWLSGLYFNPMYEKLKGHLRTLFPKPLKDDPRDYKDIPAKDLKLEAYPKTITYDDLSDELLQSVCIYAQDALIGILGHGHSGGIYACDFFTNAHKLSYPTSVGSCFDMLLDIVFKVQHQLHFVYKQCCDTTALSGWRDCVYGNGVGGSGWQFNRLQCPNQKAEQNADQIGNQTHKQTCTQKCDQTVSCGLKSPLQSFLEDGLQGFLPHHMTKVGCGVKCSVGSHRGQPCKTPMGFGDISVTASHVKKGAHLAGVLDSFCGPTSHLSRLCRKLNCLLRRAPQTLGDMLAFYHKFLYEWNGQGRVHRQDAFLQAVNDAIFGEQYGKLDVVCIQSSRTHTEKHSKGDLFSLVDCHTSPTVNAPVGSCGPYLESISNDIRRTFSETRASNYLSWIVYITETFYDLLKMLYDECNKCCGTDKSKCRVAKCAVNCNVGKQASTYNHDDSCNSIVNCSYTTPTLFKYGFVHGDALILAGKRSKRTCREFCTALGKVISDKISDESPLAKLIYITIPEYIWAIRTPFSYLLLALWSLSLLYLLHITVVRLDVLRIRSHLRSPSSHRIAAQSLLAAARVKALANVKYFSP